jgi:hypothetical protein
MPGWGQVLNTDGHAKARGKKELDSVIESDAIVGRPTHLTFSGDAISRVESYLVTLGLDSEKLWPAEK